VNPELVVQIAAPDLVASSAAKTGANAANYNFSLADIARFENAYNAGLSGSGPQRPGSVGAAQSTTAVQPSGSILDSPAMRAFVQPLDRINQAAKTLVEETQAMTADGDLTPSQTLLLTVRAHEFMFQCELTANVANRTSEGIQQLFRQQS